MEPNGNWLYYGLSIIWTLICDGVFIFFVKNSSVGLKQTKINGCVVNILF